MPANCGRKSLAFLEILFVKLIVEMSRFQFLIVTGSFCGANSRNELHVLNTALNLRLPFSVNRERNLLPSKDIRQLLFPF